MCVLNLTNSYSRFFFFFDLQNNDKIVNNNIIVYSIRLFPHVTDIDLVKKIADFYLIVYIIIDLQTISSL